MTTTQDRYRGMPALRDKAAAHVRSARGFWRHARDARRWDWPDVASTIEDRARHHLRVARWLADGAPHLPGTLVHRTVWWINRDEIRRAAK